VASVVTQTYPRWELFVVDDGSTDGTDEWLRTLSDRRVHVVPSPHVGNIAHLRNLGAKAGSGDLIAFLDSDDVWLPRKLELQVGTLRESEVGWCHSGYELMDNERLKIPTRVGGFTPVSGRIVRELLTGEVGIPVSTVVVRRKLFHTAGGFSEDPGLITREDHEFDLRLALLSDAVVVPDVLTRIREHPGRTTAGIKDAYERAARVYQLFLASQSDSDLTRLARRFWTRNLSDAAAQRLVAGHVGHAALLFASSLVRGAEVKHWLRALARGVRDRFSCCR